MSSVSNRFPTPITQRPAGEPRVTLARLATGVAVGTVALLAAAGVTDAIVSQFTSADHSAFFSTHNVTAGLLSLGGLLCLRSEAAMNVVGATLTGTFLPTRFFGR